MVIVHVSTRELSNLPTAATSISSRNSFMDSSYSYSNLVVTAAVPLPSPQLSSSSPHEVVRMIGRKVVSRVTCTASALVTGFAYGVGGRVSVPELISDALLTVPTSRIDVPPVLSPAPSEESAGGGPGVVASSGLAAVVSAPEVEGFWVPDLLEFGTGATTTVLFSTGARVDGTPRVVARVVARVSGEVLFTSRVVARVVARVSGEVLFTSRVGTTIAGELLFSMGAMAVGSPEPAVSFSTGARVSPSSLGPGVPCGGSAWRRLEES
ncbi:ORF100 [black bullhead herpesvirus]|uniref:ORF100 n=1 Tax=black bullhead herpesvirus TaxID=508441 RepID=A0A2H5AJI9_9VIRU|nr:ORF100 [black bullhead herpesvirus]AUG72304.1 ORF100 [black bullhead herpesvirus]